MSANAPPVTNNKITRTMTEALIATSIYPSNPSFVRLPRG